MKTNLIGISGKIGSGKDTIGDIFNYLCQEEDWDSYYHFMTESAVNNDDYEIKKLAGKLKDIACLITGYTREQAEDREFKEKSLGPEWMRWFTQDGLAPKNNNAGVGELLTFRKLLQLLGTETGRQTIHPNIWVNALFADYEGNNVFTATEDDGMSGTQKLVYPNWIITDVRFPNEAQAIKDRGGVVIRVNRPQFMINGKAVVRDEHPSETALDDYQFDHVIDNNGSIEELIEKVKQLNLL